MPAKRKSKVAKKPRKLRRLEFTDLMSVERITQPDVSPDGSCVAYTVARVELDENRIQRRIQMLEFSTGAITELTPGPGNHSDPAWSPDGSQLAFVSDRDGEGAQIWILPRNGGEAARVTSGYGGASSLVWAPDSRRIAFTRQVVVSADYRPNKGEKADPKTGPATAQVYGLSHPKSSAHIADSLLFRHWDAWRHRRRKHIHIVDTVSGRMEDIIQGDLDAPPIALGSSHDYAFSPDGREIAYVANPDPVVARSTNNCVFLQKIQGLKPQGKPVNISTSNASDCHPRYTPDGSALVYLARRVPGYEADKNRIKVYDRTRKRISEHLDEFDRSPDGFQIDPRGGIVFDAQDRGRKSVYRYDPSDGSVRQLTVNTTNTFFRLIPGSEDILVGRERTTRPTDLFRVSPGRGMDPLTSHGAAPEDLEDDAGAPAVRLTRFSDGLKGIIMMEAEEFWYQGAERHPVHGFLVRPPDFREGQSYPVILLIHGGPQGAFQDSFHYRWSAQMFASRGAAVAMINPRGSTGYGHSFTDQISGDWGGRCYQDLMMGVDYLFRRYRFLDRRRVAAAGASFGGFMVNWILGMSRRFRALVSHDGIFHAETMGYTTDELWFEEHEHGGLPHDNRQGFLQFSPHLNAGEFKTPTLVVQGGKDYRCPVSEGIGLFTALQTMGVESRLLYFPDEGHWVLQPANAQVWYSEVLDWLMRHLEK